MSSEERQATTIPWDPDSTTFPRRKDVPRRKDGPPEAAWVWGENDYLGRVNLLTPSRVACAAKLIQDGETVALNLPLHVPEHPSFGRCAFEHTIQMIYPELAFDDVYTLNTQSSTQWDGLRHVAFGPTAQFYNGVTARDIHGPSRDSAKGGVQFWAKHGIIGRGVLLDYWRYATEAGLTYDPFECHRISYDDLRACGHAQGVDIRPAAQGGDIQIGDILLVRSGFVAAYHRKSTLERILAASRRHGAPKDDAPRWAGVKQEEAILDWLHDCYFAAVAGDAPAFEAVPVETSYTLHEYILALWGMPLGEMFDLEKLSEICKKRGKYTFFFASAPNNCEGGISSLANALAVF